MGRRKEGRVHARFSVKLWGTDAQGRPFIESVHTHNVSTDGVLLENVHSALQAGDAVGLTYGDKKGRFKVAWVGGKGTPREGQVGLESSNKGKCIFDVPLAPPSPDAFVHAAATERRQFPRFECNASVEIRSQGAAAPMRGKLADLSLGGCYAEMMIPLKVGTKLEVAIWLDSSKISTAGMVTSSHPGFGVGVKFIGMLPADRECLQEYLKKQAALAAQPRRLGVSQDQARGAGAGGGSSKFIR
jgi:hypothetical protein